LISQRRRDIELMDQPGLEPSVHLAALHGLRRINSVARSAAILWPSIARAAKALDPVPLRVLDLACGGGDNALAIAELARRRSLAVAVHGCDISPVAIAEAKRSATSRKFDPKFFFRCDVLQQPMPAGFHVVMCSLFLHHLDHAQAVGLLRGMANAAERLVLISDLRRTWLGLGLAWVGSRLLTRSPIVHTDAVRSVAGAFVESEIERMAAASGLDRGIRCNITRHWPQRWLLQMEKS
jgi:2-polyprenyl-3-methyl-5-hydroxy-6-metoxy-1,4-benzoquinol methylase